MVLDYTGSILTQDHQYITQDISFSMDNLEEKGGLVIVGGSGSGKTLTAMSLLGLLPQNLNFDGSILLDNVPLNAKDKLGRTIVYIPQNGYEALNPKRTVKSQLKDQYKLNKKPYSDISALALLKRVGFNKPEEVLNAYSFELSGGMAQRVTLALACIGSTQIIIADEATNGLNADDSHLFMELLHQNFKEAIKIIITHDMRMALEYNHILVMKEGHIELLGTRSDILESQNSYVKALREAVPGGLDVKY